jgi:trans-aconitate methyltransferase
MSKTLYDQGFYSRQIDESLQSARIVAPLVMRLTKVASVIDVGCGLGAWLRAFSENGVALIRGIDGSYVDTSNLHMPPECFTAANLTEPIKIDEHFDLALCLEVAEHLPGRFSAQLVRELTDLAPMVLFSAAMPGQGGTGHVNEQWPEYWRNLFKERGFAMLDPIRPLIREDCRVKWWYRQNIVMFANEATISAHPALDNARSNGTAVEWVHVDMLRRAGVRNLLSHLKPAIREAILKRIPLLSSGDKNE